MMNRRQFLKAAGLCGLSLALPPFFGQHTLRAALPDNLVYTPPAPGLRVPQFIHIFLYGGPSELAGNLTNIADINTNSQNPYPPSLNPSNANNDITDNHFWGAAGGEVMETMVGNNDLSIYRTIHRIKDDSKGHGRSIAQNLGGSLDLANPGIAATLAALVERYNPFDKELDQLLLPFVSFEGESAVFRPGDLDLPLGLRPVSLNSNFDNPYSRRRYWYLDSDDETINDDEIEALATGISAMNPFHTKVNDAFSERAAMATFLDDAFNEAQIEANLPYDPLLEAPLAYPGTNFGNRLRAAVSLAISNPDSIFISLGSGGLGGWDDHSNALDRYPGRMQGLMEALQVAARHLQLVGTDRIVINVFGDFGRNVNLNNSSGWDHGNNQNLYTIGGSGIPGRTLGKLAGRTRRIGQSSRNRQFTEPTADSYQCEPFSIASTMFSYLGVENPEALTGEPAIDESDSVPNEYQAPSL